MTHAPHYDHTCCVHASATADLLMQAHKDLDELGASRDAALAALRAIDAIATHIRRAHGDTLKDTDAWRHSQEDVESMRPIIAAVLSGQPTQDRYAQALLDVQAALFPHTLRCARCWPRFEALAESVLPSVSLTTKGAGQATPKEVCADCLLSENGCAVHGGDHDYKADAERYKAALLDTIRRWDSKGEGPTAEARALLDA